MTDTIESTDGSTGAAPEGAAAKKRGGGLNSMLIADLKSMAGGLGIAGAGSMKKADLVSAIKAAQSGGQSGGQSGSQARTICSPWFPAIAWSVAISGSSRKRTPPTTSWSDWLAMA